MSILVMVPLYSIVSAHPTDHASAGVSPCVLVPWKSAATWISTRCAPAGYPSLRPGPGQATGRAWDTHRCLRGCTPPGLQG